MQSPAPVYKLIMHLSLADVLVSVVCIAGEAAWMLLVQWPFGTAACKAFKFLQMTALHGSSYVVVLIAQNRWVAVNHPLASRRHKSSVCGHVRDTLRCASPRSVLLVWLVGACLSTPQVGKLHFYRCTRVQQEGFFFLLALWREVLLGGIPAL